MNKKNNTFGTNILISKWEGVNYPQSVLGLEVVASLEDEYFKGLLEHLERWKQEILNKKFEGAEDSEYRRKYYNNLKNQLEGAKPKITIKIELEKYE